MKKAISWILLFFWLILIFTFSNQTGSVSTGLSDQVLSFLPKFIDSELLSFIVRKCAHFFEYFILAILTLNVCKNYAAISKKQLIITILFCFLYAMSDEFHQVFIAGRTPKFWDVCIDTCGSLAGIVCMLIFSKKKSTLEELGMKRKMSERN